MIYELLGFQPGEFPAGLGWHDRIREGFPQAALWALARQLKVEPQDIAELVGFPVNQMNWRERKTLMSPEVSDTLFRLAVAYHRLYALLKDEDTCGNWLRTARREVGNQIPVLLLTTHVGSKLVLDAIDRIKPVKRVEMSVPESGDDAEALEPAERANPDEEVEELR